MHSKFKKSAAVALAIFTVYLANNQAFAHDITILETYCIDSGGIIEEIPVIFTTNQGPVTGHTRSFCSFSQNNGSIHIGLETFASNTPSIAATYIKSLPEITPESTLFSGPYSNPSHNVCKNLGGSMVSYAFIGNYKSTKGETDICTFADGSMVSAWSLIYMANHRDGYDDIKNMVKAYPLT